ncbi:MAG: 1-acyl-sn-glycerol-3-phosphate acyltransferase, partial [Sandaracinaceae bacterium]|nr:1-acyl-sn-glycerol-3-phosphate acyltransferase [Sandaracinaceae bacterium]
MNESEKRSLFDWLSRKSTSPTSIQPGEALPMHLRALGLAFRSIELEPSWINGLRSLPSAALIVHVLPSSSLLDAILLDLLLRRYQLPPIEWAWGLESKWARLIWPKTKKIDSFAQPPEEKPSSVLLCLRPARTSAQLIRDSILPKFHSRLHQSSQDALRTLVLWQRQGKMTIHFFPQLFVWAKRSPRQAPSLAEFVFGTSESPSFLRSMGRLAFHRNAIHRGAQPLDLQAFLAAHPELSEDQGASALRYALLRRLERERTIVLGPIRKSSARICEEILRSPRLKRLIEHAANERKVPVSQVSREVEAELVRMAASPDPMMMSLLDPLLRFVWSRIYDGIQFEERDFERIRNAARNGPLILLPSHKSHIDYLIISSVFYQKGLAPPLIVAGDNLSFFPLGPLFRRGGAFFIRRSFHGEKLYPYIVAAYIRKVLLEGHSIELFIEGGRSRTGKLLPPKLGILTMIVDAALEARIPLQFVPIAISYERIVEEGTYVREHAGEDKKQENIGDLLRAPRILRSRYGRLYIQVGEILDLPSLFRETFGQEFTQNLHPLPISSAQRRAFISKIAHRVAYEINQATPVTPAALLALTLLCHRKRGIAHRQLVEQAEMLLRAFMEVGAPIAPLLLTQNQSLRIDSLKAAIDLFHEAKMLHIESPHPDPTEKIYSVPPEERLSVEYLKNNIIHFFVPQSIISSALGALGWEASRENL